MSEDAERAKLKEWFYIDLPPLPSDAVVIRGSIRLTPTQVDDIKRSVAYKQWRW